MFFADIKMASVKKKKKISSAVPQIQRRLEEKKVQKSQLANAMGVSNAVVTNLLNGTRPFLTKDISGVVQILGEDYEYWIKFIEKDNDDTDEEATLCTTFADAEGKLYPIYHPRVESSEDAKVKAEYMASLILALKKGGLEPS
jgi:transcriptional regulator with XRE-family HTH domain